MNTNLKHVGLILDGNRRWAKEKGKAARQGHKAGYDGLKEVCKHAILDLKIPYISAYIFSTENWNRSKDEVDYLMGLAERMANEDFKELHEKNIKVVWLGSDDNLTDKVRNSILKATEKTKDNTAGTAVICFNYGGRREIAEAAAKIDGPITEQAISDNLYVPEVPDVDLVIRTSGEQRISNFMLWRVAYSEMYFINKHWPDFKKEDLDRAVEEFNSRKRRYGK